MEYQPLLLPALERSHPPSRGSLKRWMSKWPVKGCRKFPIASCRACQTTALLSVNRQCFLSTGSNATDSSETSLAASFRHQSRHSAIRGVDTLSHPATSHSLAAASSDPTASTRHHITVSFRLAEDHIDAADTAGLSGDWAANSATSLFSSRGDVGCFQRCENVTLKHTRQSRNNQLFPLGPYRYDLKIQSLIP